MARSTGPNRPAPDVGLGALQCRAPGSGRGTDEPGQIAPGQELSGQAGRRQSFGCQRQAHQAVTGISRCGLARSSLVVYDSDLDMAVGMVPCEDGHAQERSLTAPLLERAQAGNLWMGDCNFRTRAAVGLARTVLRFYRARTRHHAASSAANGAGAPGPD